MTLVRSKEKRLSTRSAGWSAWFERRSESTWPRWAPYAFWGLAAIVLVNLQWLHLWGISGVRWVGYGIMLVCCLLLLGLVRTRWLKTLGTPGLLVCSAIVVYLFFGTIALLVADGQWQPIAGKTILRQSFFLVLLLATLCGGHMLLARVGVLPLLNGVLVLLTTSCFVILATPLLRYWDVLLTFRLPFRLTGAFTDPNDAGFVGCITIALALALLTHRRQGRLAWFGLAVGCAASLVSFSRTAFLVACGSLIILPMLNGGRRWGLFSICWLTAGLMGFALQATVASGLWSLRDLALGRELDRLDFCLPLPGTDAGLLDDCEILLATRGALAGDAPLNWGRAVPIDVWQGVHVDGSLGRVTEVSLPGMDLNGRIPPEFGDLAQLVTLRLNNNRLTGTIPPELAKLAKLDNLWLANNYLEGELPTSLAQFAPSLEEDIATDYLIPMPLSAEVQAAPTDLIRIPLPAQANVTVIPADNLFCQAGSANTGLLADCNVLLAAKETLAGSAALNWRRDLPIGFWNGVIVGDVPPIRVAGLALPHMGLNGRIPPELGKLDQLVMLILAVNNLRGPIPPELGRLADLRVLSLGANRLTAAVPPELGKLAQLDNLWLANNYLTGAVPPRLEAFGAQAFGLVTEEARRSMLTGQEQERTVSNLTRAVFCQPGQIDADLLADCNVLLAVKDTLAGNAPLNWRRDVPIASWRGVIVAGPTGRVTQVTVPAMGLNGRIPPELGNLGQLEVLRLSSNELTGSIPPELGGLADLQVLSLSANQLNDPVPPELGKLTRLRGLWLASTRLTGPFPPTLYAVAEHDLTSATFCMPSNPKIGADLLADCTRLLAGKATLAGTTPLNWSPYVPIGFWRGVTVGNRGEHVVRIDLEEQGLDGRIPPEFGDLEQLVWLSLSRNQITGTIPPELGRLNNLRTLALENNRLLDPLPPELVRDDLSLRIAGNQFSVLTTILTSRRLSMWKAHLEKGLESPIIGNGLGKLRSIASNLSNVRGTPEGIHNLYLTLFGEAGLAPLALYCVFLLFLLRLRWTAPHSPARDVVVGWAVVMALFSINYHHLLTLGPFMFLAGLSCALVASAKGEPSRPDLESHPKFPRGAEAA